MQQLTLQSVGGSVLPMELEKDGETVEVLAVESISGGARYEDAMPKELSLVRHFRDGTSIRRTYVQRPSNSSYIDPRW